jgi:hypothetical protein
MIEFGIQNCALNMQRDPAIPPGKIKHYYLRSTRQSGRVVEYVAHLYFEAKIDFADVRSGLRETCSVSNAVGIYPFDEEALWIEDMVRGVEPSSIRASAPRQVRLHPLPEYVDADAIARAETRYLQYLLRYFKRRIYRNFVLNVYSSSDETAEDFMARCLEMFSEPFRLELDNLREVFKRRLEQVKERYQKLIDWGEFDPPRRSSPFQSILHKASERIEKIFLRAELNLKPMPSIPVHANPSKFELEERLHSLEMEAYEAIGRLLSAYQEKVRNIDEYIVHPNLKDVHLVRTCILWMPDEAHER